MLLRLVSQNAKNAWKVTTVQKTSHLTTVSHAPKDTSVQMERNRRMKILANLAHTTTVSAEPKTKIVSLVHLAIFVRNGVRNIVEKYFYS
jgi:hypothetical protein